MKNEDNLETPPQVFSDKFNIDVFNNTFNNWKENSNCQEIIEYKEPEALVSCDKMSYGNIDNSQNGNYTKVQENSNDLTYCDLKNAYSKNSNLINTNQVKVKTYKNVDEYEIDRNNISYQMTPEQLKEKQIQTQKEEYLERQRLQRIQQQDRIHENHYNNIHQRMLGFNN